MQIVAVINQKGGVGKTTLVAALGFALRQTGRRVLLVDNDPQSSLSRGILGPEVVAAVRPLDTVFALYEGSAALPVRPICLGLDLIIGSQAVESLNIPDPWTAQRRYQLALRERLRPGADRWDIVLLDGPPNLHLCSWANLVAGTCLIVPLQPEDYGAQGIAHVQKSVNMVRQAANPDLRHLGYVISRISRRKTLHADYEAVLRATYGDAVFTAVLPDAIDFPEAIGARRSVLEHKPKGKAAQAIREVAAEFLARAEAPAVTTTEEAA